mmetsp:Transcript_10082/g.39275  ORF Transcript_10082/g.39275 Transcript_10082/m.39275 type:complete len:225 (+) Transcript_10082:1121-1795(+)
MPTQTATAGRTRGLAPPLAGGAGEAAQRAREPPPRRMTTRTAEASATAALGRLRSPRPSRPRPSARPSSAVQSASAAASGPTLSAWQHRGSALPCTPTGGSCSGTCSPPSDASWPFWRHARRPPLPRPMLRRSGARVSAGCGTGPWARRRPSQPRRRRGRLRPMRQPVWRPAAALTGAGAPRTPLARQPPAAHQRLAAGRLCRPRLWAPGSCRSFLPACLRSRH